MIRKANCYAVSLVESGGSRGKFFVWNAFPVCVGYAKMKLLCPHSLVPSCSLHSRRSFFFGMVYSRRSSIFSYWYFLLSI